MNTLTLIDLQDSNASSGNSLMSVVVQLSISLGVACAAALLGGFQTDLDTGQDTVLGAFHATYVSVGLMSMLAAAIFFQLGSEDGRTSPRRVDPEKDPTSSRAREDEAHPRNLWMTALIVLPRLALAAGLPRGFFY